MDPIDLNALIPELANVQEGMIMPHQHTMKMAVPVSVSVELSDDAIVLRTETIHGSHVVYLLVDVARNLGQTLLDTANDARVHVTVDTDDIMRIERDAGQN
jgi:hypothetical protein